MHFHKFLPLILLSAATAALAQAVTPQAVPHQAVPHQPGPFTQHMADRLRRELPDVPVAVKSPLTISAGELQVNLDRVHSFCRRNAEECAAEFERFAQAVAQVHRDRSAPPTKDAVRLIVRTGPYLQALLSQQAQASGKAPNVQSRRLVDGLHVLVALDSPRAIRMLSEADNEKLGLSADEAFALGAANLQRQLKPIEEAAQPAAGGQIGQITGDSYEPSRLALPESWLPLAKAQGGTLIVAAPTTNLLLYISEDSPAAIDALRTLARNVMSQAPNRLSGTLLRWRDGGWDVVAQ
jgi:hypothetical protein